MKVITETLEQDGSQWAAIVEVQGVVYRASYVNNKLSCGLGPYKYNPRRPRWAEKSVREWAEKQIGKLSPEWMQLHREMYA